MIRDALAPIRRRLSGLRAEAKNAATAENDVSRAPDFIAKAQQLRALAETFGYDPDKVALAPQKPPFDYLGQLFVSEGESFPDGRISIYYDPQMSDARMGCCIAHELQHVRYGAVRNAYRAESGEGLLHRRFAAYTPALLAARRGVSDYSNEHWDAWKGATLPELFSMELEEGQSEPINETLAEVAKAFYNWGADVRIDPMWKALKQAIDVEYETIRADQP